MILGFRLFILVYAEVLLFWGLGLTWIAWVF